jgi:YVTN family beta-propeller protein
MMAQLSERKMARNPSNTPVLVETLAVFALVVMMSAAGITLPSGIRDTSHPPLVSFSKVMPAPRVLPTFASASASERSSSDGLTLASTPSPIITIPVGQYPTSVAYDSGKGEVFVTNSYCFPGGSCGLGSVSIISDANNTVVATVPVGSNPTSVAYDSSKGEVFVANTGAQTDPWNNVSVISDTTNTVVATIQVGESPSGVAYDSGKGEIFVANSNSNNVSVIDDSSDTVVATIFMHTVIPESVAYDSGKGEVFVTYTDGNNVTVISDATNTVVATVPVGAAPFDVAYDSGKGALYVANFGSHNVSVVSDETNTVVATVPSVGTIPNDVAYDSGNGELFVTNGGSAGPDSDSVCVISDETNTVVAVTPVGLRPWGAAYDSGKGEVFIANVDSNNVSVIPTQLSVVATANRTSGPAYLPVTFRASAFAGSWNYTSWNWSFGDGNFSALQNPSHTYATPGSYPVSVVVTDSNRTKATSNTIWIDVSQPTPFTATLLASRSSVDVGEPAWFNTTVGGGTGPFSFIYTNSSPPSSAGCAVSSSFSSSVVRCVPSQSGLNLSFSVRVVDAYGAMSNASSPVLSVDPVLTASVTVSKATLWLGNSVFISGAAGGGLAPYTYNFAGLPPGCVQQGTDTIGCLPTESGNYTIQFSVQDANDWGVSATQPLSIIFDFTVVAPSSDAAGQMFTIQVDSAPGFGALTYDYSNLPSGCISMDTPTLNCTPTATGTYSITVSVHDQAGDHNAHSVVVQVVPAPKGTSGFLGLPGNEGYLLIAVIALAAVVVAIVIYGRGPRTEIGAGHGSSNEVYAEFKIPPPRETDTNEKGESKSPEKSPQADPMGDLI